jgi:hypothetical protein
MISSDRTTLEPVVLGGKLQMRTVTLTVIGLVIASSCEFAQDLSLGAVAGTNLTEGITQVPGFNAASGPRSVIAGPMLEWRFPLGFSLEADGLYRGLRGEFTGSGGSSFTEVTWEFPVLAKYRVWRRGPGARLTPLIEAGPSFRHTGLRSHVGFTAGAGLALRIGRMSIAPTLRYTRWEMPSFSITPANQLEMVVGVSTISQVNSRPLGPRIAFGLTAGVNLTSDFRSVSYPVVIYQFVPLPGGGSTNQVINATGYNSMGPRQFLIGPLRLR